VNIAEAKKTRAILKDAMLALVTELVDLPSKVTNPGWLDEVAAEEHIELNVSVLRDFPSRRGPKESVLLGRFRSGCGVEQNA
jgi:hypothetical protein